MIEMIFFFSERCSRSYTRVYVLNKNERERETEDESDGAGRCLKATDMSAWPISQNLSNLPQVE